MFAAALLVVPTIFAPTAPNMWTAVGLVSVAAAAHQAWSANLFTSVSDMFPRQAVATVMGIGGFAGAMAGMLFQRVTGYILDASRSNYTVIFIIAGTTYLLALLIFHLLVPRMAPAKVEVIGAK
jgi:ACS family hexuronate transporter-like MFS transporter